MGQSQRLCGLLGDPSLLIQIPLLHRPAEAVVAFEPLAEVDLAAAG